MGEKSGLLAASLESSPRPMAVVRGMHSPGRCNARPELISKGAPAAAITGNPAMSTLQSQAVMMVEQTLAVRHL